MIEQLIKTPREHGEPPENTPNLPVDWGFDDGAPRCGICGEKKVKLPIKTTYKQLDIWVCDNVPDGERLPCDGLSRRNSIMTWRELDV